MIKTFDELSHYLKLQETRFTKIMAILEVVEIAIIKIEKDIVKLKEQKNNGNRTTN